MGAGKIPSLSLFALGMILMVFNITGLFKSLRNAELYSEVTSYEDDIAVRFEETRKSWDRAIDECRKAAKLSSDTGPMCQRPLQ